MISELLPEEKRRMHLLEQQLVELEGGSSGVTTNDVASGLDDMSAKLDDLERLIQMEPKVRKDDYRRRVQHLRTTHSHIKKSLVSFMKRKDKVDYSLQKRELFAGASVGSRNGGDAALEMAESGSLDRSGKMMSEYIAAGQETLQELVGQKERLKNIQRKVFDILNYLGVGNSIMKAVENRETVDRYIVFAGMFLILLLIFLLWYFIRR